MALPVTHHERITRALPRNVVVFGAGDHAAMLAPILARKNCRPVAWFDKDRAVESPEPRFHSLETLTLWLWENEAMPLGAVVAIARGGDRLDYQTWLEKQHSIDCPTVAHETAWLEDSAEIGQGCHFLTHSVVGVHCRLGRGVILSPKAMVEHHSVLDDGVQIGPGAVVNGRVSIGARSFVGAGAVVLPRLTIGADAIVGAGAVVTRDVPDGVTVTGIPAQMRVKEPA